MWPNPYCCDPKRVFWVVGIGLHLRHATDIRPGAFPSGEWIPTLCETWFRLPFPTVSGVQPRSKSVEHKCPQCTEIADSQGYRSIIWDF